MLTQAAEGNVQLLAYVRERERINLLAEVLLLKQDLAEQEFTPL